MELHQVEKERAVLVSVDLGESGAEASLAELEELAKTAGAEVIAAVTQKRKSYDPVTCIGGGRLLELADFCQSSRVDLIIFDCELSPVWQRNIEDRTGVRTIDRTLLILDIFAAHAKTREGILQVELAQYQYALTRLAGKGGELSRLGGGIGTRGPGESKLETDRRHIRRRIITIRQQLETVKRSRESLRRRRAKNRLATVAIVGYTNAGKSTLFNVLTGADVLAQDKLFATLDPTSRGVSLPNGRTVLLIDTVGLIRNLPHHLVDAFRATLEETAQADLLLNVCDASSPEAGVHLQVTAGLLKELGCPQDKIIPVLNKCDLAPALEGLAGPGAVCISAKAGIGLDALLERIAAALPPSSFRVRLLLPFAQGALAAKIRTSGVVHSQTFTAEGVLMEATVDAAVYPKLVPYLAKGDGQCPSDTDGSS